MEPRPGGSPWRTSGSTQSHKSSSWSSIWIQKCHSWAMMAHPGLVEAPFGALQANIGALEAPFGGNEGSSWGHGGFPQRNGFSPQSHGGSPWRYCGLTLSFEARQGVMEANFATVRTHQKTQSCGGLPWSCCTACTLHSVYGYTLQYNLAICMEPWRLTFYIWRLRIKPWRSRLSLSGSMQASLTCDSQC